MTNEELVARIERLLTVDIQEPHVVDTLIGALLGFVAACDSWAMGPCPGFTCTEAEQIVDLLRVVAGDTEADHLLSSHAATDDEGDAHYDARDAELLTREGDTP